MPPVKTMASRAAERREVGADVLACAVAEDLDGEASAAVVVLLRLGEQFAHVVREAADAEQAGLLVEQHLDVVQRQPFLDGDVVEDRRVEVAGACAHDEPLERREAHRGVDRVAV
jgi:hypothetical protein